jgi:hypothetical protein
MAFFDILIWKSKKAVPAGVTIVPATWLQTVRGVVHVSAKRIGNEQRTAFSFSPQSPVASTRACGGGLWCCGGYMRYPPSKIDSLPLQFPFL